MSSSRLALALLSSALVASCGDISTPAAGGGLRVINATASAIDAIVDGKTVLSGVSAANVSSSASLTAGSHQLVFRTAAGASASVAIQSKAGETVTAAATPAASSIAASVVVDTGSIVPAGKSKLKVVHLSANASAIEIWRTQPDFQTPVHIMTPFAYQAASPYLQSDPGNWEVFVTRPNSATRLATTGPINVPAGSRRTAVLLDSAGVLKFRIME